MSNAVFMHRSDSIYKDRPAEQYQFPPQYLSRASAAVGDYILYLEPRRVRETRGYFAVAKVQEIIRDPSDAGMYLAIIEPGSYLDFPNPVPFNGPDGVIERGVLNEQGRISGRAQSAVRPISRADFARIANAGLDENDVMPRVDMPAQSFAFAEEQAPFDHQRRDRMSFIGSRVVRDRVFRRSVLNAYSERCAVTGLRLINGGGRAEAEAAHIRPVEADGPDIVSNGLCLSGTAHWMFDRGLISLDDDLRILVSRQVNNADEVTSLINRSGFAIAPLRSAHRPHPVFLGWHRDHCFKH